jgi:predicted MFS family arabinose efflux permease
VKKDELGTALGYFENNAPACATTGSASAACSPAPASPGPAARRSSAKGYRPASASLLAQVTPRSRQVMVFAMSRLALNLGTTAAPLLGAALITVSYRLLFWGEAVAALSCVAVMLLLVPARSEAAARPRMVLDPSPDGAELVDPRVAGEPERKPRGGYLAIAADRRYLLYLVAITVNSAVYIQYVATLPLAMRAAGFRPFWYSVMVALNGLVVILFELPVTTVVSRWPARRVIGVGFPLLGVGLAAYSLPAGLAVFVTGTLLWSLAEIIEGPTMFAYPAQAGPEWLQGRYIGAGHGMFGLGAAIGPVVGVALWSALGSRFWIVCGLVSVLALLPGWRGIRPERAREGAASA